MTAAGQLDLYWEIGCWSWDVCAGTIIAREAGGKVYGAWSPSPGPSPAPLSLLFADAHPSPRHTGKGGAPFAPQDLMGHHFFVVRAIADSDGETGEQAQDRIAKEFFALAEEY